MVAKMAATATTDAPRVETRETDITSHLITSVAIVMGKGTLGTLVEILSKARVEVGYLTSWEQSVIDDLTNEILSRLA